MHSVDVTQETDTKALTKVQACATWGYEPCSCQDSYEHYQMSKAEHPDREKHNTQIRCTDILV